MSSPRSQAAGDGERKLVTTLFADLSGFTAISETMDPEEVRELVNDCFDVLVPVVESCGGTVDKFIGDEVMALFGAPVAHEDDAVRCLAAAQGMMDRFAEFSRSRNLDLGMHIGVETGTVVTGGLGSRGREEYSVIGDAVNLAARLADASEAGQVLVGPAAHHLAADHFEFEELEPLDLKGKAEPVPVCLLLGARSGGAGERRLRVSSALVGREAEMRLIGGALERLEFGSGVALAVVGEPGLGKSRLVAEVRRASPPGVRWAEGKGQAYGETTSYAVAAGLLDDLIGVRSDSPTAEVEAALRAAVRSAFPDPAVSAGVFPYLARLRGLPLPPDEAERVGHLAPEALRDRLRTSFVAFVRAECLARPLVLVWEDLHWADSSSLDVAEAVLALTVECPLTVLLVFRPHEGGMDEWHERLATTAPGDLFTVALAPLDEEESSMLVDSLLEVENLPESAKRLILEKADGNPFFLEELLRSLLDAGLVVVRDGRAVATERIAELRVPDTVQGVAAARIDALAPLDKESLQDASVIGRAFQRPVLAELWERSSAASAGSGSEPLGGSLEELCRRELVRERSDVDYLFKHAVTRDVAYSSLLRARRRALHEIAAQVIEELYPDRLDELSATLARHWRAAGVHDRALECLIAGAERARATFSNAEALELYAAALEEAGDDAAKKAEIQENIGDVLTLAGRHEDARAHFEAALEGPGSALSRARLLRKLGDTWVPASAPAEASGAFDRAELALGPTPDGEAPEWWHEWVDIQTARMWLCYWIDDTAGMNIWMERATAALASPAEPLQQGSLLRMLALLELRRTRFHPSEEAELWAREYVDIAEARGDLAEAGRALFACAFVLTWRGDLDGAQSEFGRTLRLCRRIGDVIGEMRALTYLAVVHRRRGEARAVPPLATEALGLAVAADLREYIGIGHGNLAWAAWRAGDLDLARAEGEASWNALREVPATPFMWMGLWPLLGARLAQRDEAGGPELARRMLEAAQMKLPDDLEEPLASAVAASDAGDAAAAAGFLRTAVARAEKSEWGWL